MKYMNQIVIFRPPQTPLSKLVFDQHLFIFWPISIKEVSKCSGDHTASNYRALHILALKKKQQQQHFIAHPNYRPSAKTRPNIRYCYTIQQIHTMEPRQQQDWSLD